MSNPHVQELIIVFPVYPGVTHLDFTGPHQFFSELPGAKPVVASVEAKPVATDGFTFSNLEPLEQIDRCDVLCVPGGSGCVDAIRDSRYMAEIKRLAGQSRYLTSVCTGSLILAAAGLLKGKRAACHWASHDFLPLFGAIPDRGRVVRDGNVITGGGVTAGIDFALTMAAELTSPTIAQAVQLLLEYAPAPPFDSGTPDRAPEDVLAWVRSRNATAMAERAAALKKLAA